MKSRNRNLSIAVLGLTIMCVVACKARDPESLPLEAIEDVSTSATDFPIGEMGSSSGGGGFADETARAVLAASVQELTHDIRRASPEIFGELPEGWTPEKIADLFENIQINFGENRRRNGRNLNFDYGYTKNGSPYIEVLQAFSNGLSGVVFELKGIEQRRELIVGTKLRLAHELSHLLGYGLTDETDSDARAMGFRLLKALDSDTISCHMTDDYPEYLTDIVYGLMDSDSKGASKEEFMDTYYPSFDESASPSSILDTTAYAFQIAINFPTGLGRVAMAPMSILNMRLKGVAPMSTLFSGGLDPSQLFSDIERREPWFRRFSSSLGFYRNPGFFFRPTGFWAEDTYHYFSRNEDLTIEVGYAASEYWGWSLKYDPKTSTAKYFEFIKSQTYPGLPSELELDLNCKRRVYEFIPSSESDKKMWRDFMDRFRKDPRELPLGAVFGWRD